MVKVYFSIVPSPVARLIIFKPIATLRGEIYPFFSF